MIFVIIQAFSLFAWMTHTFYYAVLYEQDTILMLLRILVNILALCGYFYKVFTFGYLFGSRIAIVKSILIGLSLIFLVILAFLKHAEIISIVVESMLFFIQVSFVSVVLYALTTKVFA